MAVTGGYWWLPEGDFLGSMFKCVSLDNWQCWVIHPDIAILSKSAIVSGKTKSLLIEHGHRQFVDHHDHLNDLQ